LERPPVGVVLHQRGAQRVLERLPVLERYVAHGLHGVEVLGEADREPGQAQLLDETGQEVDQAGAASTASSLAAFVMSDWYLRRMCSVSLARSASMVSM